MFVALQMPVGPRRPGLVPAEKASILNEAASGFQIFTGTIAFHHGMSECLCTAEGKQIMQIILSNKHRTWTTVKLGK
jgi:hypothetical protein